MHAHLETILFGRDTGICLVEEAICAKSLQTDGETDDGRRAIELAHRHELKTAQFIQESPANATVTRNSAVIPRWPSAAIFDIIEPEIAPFDPLILKTLA